MKKLAGHQPYLFPYIGYFTVINSVDYFIHGDALQYEKQSWINRNRIISETGEVRYIIVPTLNRSLSNKINEVQIDYSQNWQKKMINQLGYYRKAPYYKDVIEILEELFSINYSNIADLNIAATELVVKRIGIETALYRMSEVDIDTSLVTKSDEWGIASCKAFDGVDTFRNAPGGMSFYDPEKYKRAGLNIEFLQNRLRPYNQNNNEFIPGLSILDVLMFNSPEEVKEMVNDYYIL